MTVCEVQTDRTLARVSTRGGTADVDAAAAVVAAAAEADAGTNTYSCCRHSAATSQWPPRSLYCYYHSLTTRRQWPWLEETQSPGPLLPCRHSASRPDPVAPLEGQVLLIALDFVAQVTLWLNFPIDRDLEFDLDLDLALARDCCQVRLDSDPVS